MSLRTCKDKTAKNKKCSRILTGRQKKFCFQHGRKSRKSKKRKRNGRKQSRRRNPSLTKLRALLHRVDAIISRLCDKYNCIPVECAETCDVPYYQRPYVSRHYRRRRRNPYGRRRNPHYLDRFSRPFSAGLARAWMGEEIYPEPVTPPSPKIILIVGGDRSYVPDWMESKEEAGLWRVIQIHQVDNDLEQQLGAIYPDLILTFVKAEKPFRPSKHTFYKVREYAKGSNSRGITIPRITVNKGFSHVIQRATELGVDWFVDAYPDKTYIPPEDLEPKAPKKPMTAAKLAHHEKRAKRFHEKGVTEADIMYAQAKYIRDESSKCSLCDTKLKYQFRLLFDRPSSPDPIIFHPVGSVCITDWMDSLPDSKGKLAFGVKLKAEMEKVLAIKAVKKKAAAEIKRAEGAIRREREKQRRAKLKRERAERVAKKKKTKKVVKKKAVRKKKVVKRKITEKLRRKFDEAQIRFGWPEVDEEIVGDAYGPVYQPPAYGPVYSPDPMTTILDEEKMRMMAKFMNEGMTRGEAEAAYEEWADW